MIVRDGDYFGRTVNVAARIADYARPREVLVSAAVTEEVPTPAGVEYEQIGDIPLKGVPEPVPLIRARPR